MNQIIIIGVIVFLVMIIGSGLIYYYYFGERGNLRIYTKCMCDKFKENKNINEIEEGKKCFKKIEGKEDVTHSVFRMRSKDRYKEMWEEYELCKK